MKLAVFFSVLFLSAPLLAETATNSLNSQGRTIVIQDSPGKLVNPPNVFVESGKEEISGSPEAGLKPAYRQWENRCNEWKSDLRHLNGNNLMVVSCGTPKKSTEKIQSENYYTYSSTGTYKIKVVGK